MPRTISTTISDATHRILRSLVAQNNTTNAAVLTAAIAQFFENHPVELLSEEDLLRRPLRGALTPEQEVERAEAAEVMDYFFEHGDGDPRGDVPR